MTTPLDDNPPPPQKKRHRKASTSRWIGIALGTLGLLGLGAGTAAGATRVDHIPGTGTFVGPATVDVIGSFMVPQDSGLFTHDEGDCTLSDGYSDFTVGASITVSNSEGDTAIGSLQTPINLGTVCVFGFEVDDVVIADGSYSVTFSHRGSITYTLQQLRDKPALGIGDALD